LYIIGIGVDIIEIGRIRAACLNRSSFVTRIFTAAEREYAFEKSSPWQHLAARFAAKEAVTKSLGRSFSWQEVEIIGRAGAVPIVRLHGRAKEIAAGLKVSEIKLSLSHSRQYAVAQALSLGGVGIESSFGSGNARHR